MSRNLVFLDLRTLQNFIGFCLLCKNTGLCWHTNQFLRSPALLVYCEDRENLSDFGVAELDTGDTPSSHSIEPLFDPNQTTGLLFSKQVEISFI